MVVPVERLQIERLGKVRVNEFVGLTRLTRLIVVSRTDVFGPAEELNEAPPGPVRPHSAIAARTSP